MTERFSLVDDLQLVPEGASFAMLLRHAERGELKAGEVGENCLLTSKGRCDARDFGSLLARARITRVYSSPVLRCVDTGKEIIEGAGIDQRDVNVRKMLGDPGIYISNRFMASLSFKMYGNVGVIERYVKHGGLIGFMPLSRGSSLFMSDIFNDLSGQGSHNVYISHDMTLIPMISHYTGEHFGAEKWLDYLDGLILAKVDGRIQVIRNRKTYPLKTE
jgi:broad specificity phosphatase PhoE